MELRRLLPALALGLLVVASTAAQVMASSDAEDQVRLVIKDMLEARWTAHDAERLLTHVADDAKMESFSGSTITKPQYAEAVKKGIDRSKATPKITVSHDIVKMTLPDATHAVALIEQNAYETQATFGAPQRVENNRFEWTFELRNGKWLVVGQRWVKKN